MELCDDQVEMRKQLDRLEPGGFDKYNAYLDNAQLNLEVCVILHILDVEPLVYMGL